MQVNNIELTNIGSFDHLDLPIAPTKDRQSNVTVIVGNNGSGKTTILKGLDTGLQLATLIITQQLEEDPAIFPQLRKKPNKPIEIGITIYSSTLQKEIEWFISSQNRNYENNNRNAAAIKYLKKYAQNIYLYADTSLPLIGYYPAERAISTVSTISNVSGLDKIIDENSLSYLFSAYDNYLAENKDTPAVIFNFQTFFEWFRLREDAENETGMPSEMYAKISELLKHNIEDIEHKTWQELSQMQIKSRDPQLNAVRYAISAFMPDYKNLHIQRKPEPQMMVTKGKETLNINQLSQGEKSFLALIGDIARRLAILNPGRDNPLEGEGIVMIDEVDLHLHPKWQRSLIERLTTTFPNLQFVLTTHSPLVISDSKDVLVYVLDDGEVTQMDNLYGLDANQVLLEVMDTDIRNAKAEDDIADLLDHIQDGELKEAKIKLEALEQEMAQGHYELTKAKLLIRKAELRHAKNH